MNFSNFYIKNDKISTLKRIILEVIIIFTIILFIGLFNKNFLFFSDQVHFLYSYPDNSQLISPISPISDVSYISQNGSQQYRIDNQIINNDLTEFEIQLPSGVKEDIINKVDIKLDYSIHGSNNILLGIKNIDNTISYKPIFNPNLNELSWENIISDDLSLWQKNKKYNSIEDFLSNPPREVYNIISPDNNSEPIINYAIADYYSNLDQSEMVAQSLMGKTFTQDRTFTPYIEGTFNAYTYLTSPGDLQLEVIKVDFNYYEGADPLETTITSSTDKAISNQVITDDGNISANNELGPKQSDIISIQNMPSGLYKIKTGSADSLTKIILNQPLLVIANSVMIRDDISESINQHSIYTNALSIKIPAWHIPASNQTISINDDHILILDSTRLEEAPKIVNLSGDTLNKIVLEKNHLLVQNNDAITGYFSFSENSFFNPTPLGMKKLNTIEIDAISNYEYLLSSYNPPQEFENNYISQTSFNLDSDYFYEGKIIFSINIPDLQKNQSLVKINAIDVTLSK
ncbi:hypothetical protein KKC06_00155 [Patescibacteria group bacterium]|nr:hypothetical protein [Patescibacteria group bacterium]